MKKNKLWTFLALLSTSILLGACSSASGSNSDSQPSSSETKKSEQEIAKEDAQTLLNAILTKDDKGFARIYGVKYDKWTEEEIFPNLIDEIIKDNGLSPEADYTFQYAKDFDKMTPTQVISNFLKSRRDNLKDVGEFKIKEVNVDGDKATVTVESRNINNTASANAISNLYLIIFGGSLDALAGMNQANKLDTEFKKVQTLVSYFLYQANFDNLLVSYSDVPLRLNETPLTEGTYEVTFDLEKNEDDHWVISSDAYRTLVGDYTNDSESASDYVYPDGTSDKDTNTEESSSSDSAA